MRPLVLVLSLVLLTMAALAAGRSWSGAHAVWQALLTGPEGPERMIWALRMPRVLVGLAAGAALGSAGLVFQSLLRNPLASPDVIGVTQASAMGAVVAMAAGGTALTGALTGGTAAILCLAWLAAHPREGIEPRAVVLLGLGLSILCAALTEAVILRAGDNSAATMMTWLAGSLNATGWPEAALAPWLALLLVPLMAATRTLDRLELGDELARALGLRVGPLRAALGLLAALAAAGAVALCGPMGFVALAAGPVSRWACGGRPNPAMAAVTGAAFVTLADIAARSLASWALLPAGLYTALIGAPVLVAAVRLQARRDS